MTEVRNWQELSRAIVKFIRDQYGIEETMLRRTATLEEDLDLGPEQLEQILDYISEAFGVRFPEATLDEVVRLEELCLLSCWLRGFFKQPSFLSDAFIGHCRAINPRATPLV